MSHFVEMPTFEIEGKEYRFKRFGVLTAQHLMKLVQEGWKNGVLDLNLHLEQMQLLAPPGTERPEVTPDLVLFFSVNHCLSEFLDLMEEYLVEVMPDKTLRPIPFEELTNADKFPLYSLVILGSYFISHPDIGMFTAAFAKGKELPLVKDLLEQIKKKI